jgi:hypothetical protein
MDQTGCRIFSRPFLRETNILAVGLGQIQASHNIPSSIFSCRHRIYISGRLFRAAQEVCAVHLRKEIRSEVVLTETRRGAERVLVTVVTG